MSASLKYHFDRFRASKLSFVVLFFVYFGFFYASSYAVMGLSSKHGLYSPFIAQYLDYVTALRSLLARGGAAFLSLIGIHSDHGPNFIRVGHVRIMIRNSCLGIGVISFWWAIVLAYPQRIALKIKYFAIGTIMIMTLNMMRLGFLAYIYNTDFGKQHRSIDHHLIFNIIIYIFIFALMFRWLNIKPYIKQQEYSN